MENDENVVRFQKASIDRPTAMNKMTANCICDLSSGHP